MALQNRALTKLTTKKHEDQRINCLTNKEATTICQSSFRQSVIIKQICLIELYPMIPVKLVNCDLDTTLQSSARLAAA